MRNVDPGPILEVRQLMPRRSNISYFFRFANKCITILEFDNRNFYCGEWRKRLQSSSQLNIRCNSKNSCDGNYHKIKATIKIIIKMKFLRMN